MFHFLKIKKEKEKTRWKLSVNFCFSQNNNAYTKHEIWHILPLCYINILLYTSWNDVMKGWGPVSMSAGLLFHTMKKWNRNVKPPLITIVELQILNAYTKKIMKKKTPLPSLYHHHHHHHHHHRRRHYHQCYHHRLLAPPGANPVWSPLGWRKHIINIIVIVVIIIIIIIINNIIITIVINFLPLSVADCV